MSYSTMVADDSASRFLSRTAGLLMLCFALAFIAPSSQADPGTTDNGTSVDFPDAAAVAELIDQLASDRYVERKAAEQALLDRGMQVFDQVDAATKSLDPEVAASCRYVLTRLTVSWARRDDPPSVKKVFTTYGRLDQNNRIRNADMLSKMGPEAIPALVRIIRYDREPDVSDSAAMYLLRGDELSREWPAETAAVIRREIGTSVRPGADWVRALATQIETPEQAMSAWQPILNRFRSMKDDVGYDEVKQRQYAALLWNAFRIAARTEDWNLAKTTIDELVEASPSELEQNLTKVLSDLAEKKSWAIIDHVVDEHRERLDNSKNLLYVAAHARHMQGRIEDANQLADAALAVPAGTPSRSIYAYSSAITIALLLEQQNHVEWARREYRQEIDNNSAASATHSYASYRLSQSLHDWEQHLDAANVIGELAKVLRENNQLKQNYGRIQQRAAMSNMFVLPTVDEVFAFEKYYLACHHLLKDETEKAWEHLEDAIDHNSDNADIVIAMYRATEPETKEREKALAKIDRLTQTYQLQIDRDPDNATPYNQWAWLISNTTGDFQKAIRYSHRSLELQPGSGGYLDTLGRCYFSAGDIDNAIKYQREACEKEPSMRVLKRQLEEFETALEKQQAEAKDQA